MASQRKQFPFSDFEAKWQSRWLAERAFRAPNPGDRDFDPTQPKYYVLDMFPYPSGEGLHVGHVEGYTATDIIARFKRMHGFNVLHPMGWDAFGLPAEQFAIKTGRHPRVTTENNIGRFRAQLQSLGFSYDWAREFSTTDPAYFRWTQWIFLKLYNSWFNPASRKAEPIETYTGEHPDDVRLAYVAEMPVNWCPALGTVLANEEVVEGRSEVGGHPVERRPMQQWMLRITAYAERLMDELEGLDWPEGIKLLQRNWIGRSEGAMVKFQISNSPSEIEVFTTRPDTLFGATYMVLSPEHPLVKQICGPDRRAAVEAYQKEVGAKSDMERTELAKEKTGVFTGAFAINPVNDEKIPIWIADYVLMGYGTGAIMAVPAHDERDFEFAKKFGLEIRQVVRESGRKGDETNGSPEPAPDSAFTDNGIVINSGLLNGLPTAEAKIRMIASLEQNDRGRATINYKLRDWLFSRQRYWGEPFPIVWTEGRHRALADTELPVVQPEMQDFKPTGTPDPPLSRAREWLKYSEHARRETNTMPQWAGSCWYYLRFCDPGNTARFVGAEAEAYWMTGHKEAGAFDQRHPGGVDLYVGGTEHAVLHLLYARFWHKVMYDLGYLSTPEPFQRLVNQGVILGPDNQKMSKSRGNVVNPENVIAEYGADSLRLYEMFMGPLEQMKPWSMNGVEGVYRFLGRVWRLVMEETQEGGWALSPNLAEIELTSQQSRIAHATIKKVTEDLDSFAFNTAISQMMIFTNEFVNLRPRPVAGLRILLPLLSPFAPHMADELWTRLREKFPGFEGRASSQRWPHYDEKFLAVDEVDYGVQVNGKVRDRIQARKDASDAQLQESALAAPRVREAIAGRPVSKIVIVRDKLVNIVVPK
ncbi:MAG: leucine--tRNA ligase [Terrimicrobiaceae bacterium]